MSATIAIAANTFDSRLATLQHLLITGVDHLQEEEPTYFARRLAPDMFALGTQVAFTCNQPRNFSLWLAGKPANDLEPAVTSMATAARYVAETRALLSPHLDSNAALPARKLLGLGPELQADLTGQEYLQDFLLPNFYFHLVTAYAILRQAGVPVGKKDYMQHLLPKVRPVPATTSAS